MAQHEVITRGGDAFLLKLRESALSSGSMSEEQFFFTDRYFLYSQ